MLTASQKAAALAIVNVFETGSVRGDYGSVTLLPGDTGHLTFGRSQTTLASGGGAGLLGALLDGYCNTPGARFARLMTPFVARAREPDLALDHDAKFKNLLRASADDPVMRDTQDVFFEQAYWQRAAKAAGANFKLPLSFAVVYDSFVHGSWTVIRKRAVAAVGEPAAVDEKRWIAAYVDERLRWLANHPNLLLRKTVYRMETFRRLMELDLWNLELPFIVRGLEVNLETLGALPSNCYAGPAPGSRALGLQSPMQRGLDVRLLQLALSMQGIDVVADGFFGKGSAKAMREYTAAEGLPVSATADAGLVEQLAETLG